MTAKLIAFPGPRQPTASEQTMADLLRRLADDSERGRIAGCSVIVTTSDGKVRTFGEVPSLTIRRL